MKILFETYTFNAASKQITFNTTDVVTLEQLLVITNVTTNRIIYNFADPSAGGSIVNNVLTLDYNTTAMSSTDKLQIFIDNNATPASEDTLQALQDQTALLSRMVKLLEPSSVAGSTGRQQVDISTAPQIVTVAMLPVRVIDDIGCIDSKLLENLAYAVFSTPSSHLCDGNHVLFLPEYCTMVEKLPPFIYILSLS